MTTSEWPDKLPLPAQLVVWACKGLTPTEKIVWYHHWFLDQGGADACYAGPKSMSARLGTSLKTIEESRTRLHRLGLLAKRKRVEGREPFSYRAALPGIARAPGTFREAADRAAEFADVLDGHIAAIETGPRIVGGRDPGKRGAEAPGIVGSSAGGAPREGGRGMGASSASLPERQLPTPVEDRQDAEEARGGSVRARTEKQGSMERIGDVIGRATRASA